jgi:outer membrane receptor protein involved in Fe transport
MQRFAVSVFFVLCVAGVVHAAGEGGADYGLPFSVGSPLNDDAGREPLATATYYELTGEDLVALGAETIADALFLVPDVFTYHADAWPERGERLTRVRGIGPDGLQVILDGVPLEHGLFGTVNLTDIPANQVARLRVYPGPAPLVFGAESGGGVVEIVTRRAGEPVTAQFDGRFGDRRHALFSLGVGDTYKAFQYFAMASHQSAAGEPLPLAFDRTRNEDGGMREGSAYQRNHFRARVGLTMPDRAEAHFTFFYDVVDRDVPPNAVDPTGEFRRFPQNDRLGGNLNVRLGAFGPFHLDGEAYLVELAELREDYADRDYTELLRERDYRNVRTGGGLTPWFDFGPASRLTLRATGRRDEVEFFIQDEPRTRFFLERYGVALMDDANPLTWLHLSLGAGLLDLRPRRSDTLPPGDDLVGWHGRAGVAVGPFQGFTARVAAGTNPQFPTVEQWFDSNLGDPDLRAASLTNVEVAAAYEPQLGTTLSLIGFWQRLRDGIALIDDPNSDWETFANDVDRTATGATLVVASRPIAGLYLAANGSYTGYTDDKTGDTVRLRYQPELTGALDVRYRFWFGFGLAAQLYGAGARRDIVDGEVVDLTAYSLVNARLFYSYRDHVEVYLQGRNLFDVPYETKRYFPETGRLLTAGLKLTY